MRMPSRISRLTPAALACAASIASLQALAAMPAASASVSPAPVATAPAPTASTSSSSSPPASSGSTTGSGSSSNASANGAPSLTNESTGRISNADAIGPTADTAPFGPGGTFTTDNGNPELGLSPGQTSTGTMVGNEPSGLDTGNTLNNNPAGRGVTGPNDLTVGTTGILPTDVTSVGGGYVGGGGTAVGGTAVAISPGRGAGSATPLLDQVTRNAQARIESRRQSGATPRVIGIAPRTNVDRTDEMPDDPIIRY